MLVVFKAMSRRIGTVGDDDVLFRFRLRLFSLAEELGNVRAACRAMGVHPSTYYHWKTRVERSGLEMLRPRERRAPRMPNQTSPVIEGRILAFSLGHPGLGPRRISASLAQERWGGIVVSPNGVWRVLRRHGLSRRISRLSLVAGYAAPAGPAGRPAEPERHVEVDHPGELVGFDCFHVGRLSGTRGRVWQYTAIDLATSYTWAELHTTPLNPSARNTSHLAKRVAADLAARGWPLERALTDIQTRSCAWVLAPSAGDVRIRVSGPRPSPLSERSERSATPGLLMMRMGGVSAGGWMALLGTR
jgi:transposase